MKTNKFYTEKTLASWDEAAPRHDAINAALYEDVASDQFNSLNPDFNQLVDSCGVGGKSVVQICCNNGIDLLSVKKKGAGRCLGIDGSSAFVAQARSLAVAAGHPDIEFLSADIYDLPARQLEPFDFAMTTVGVLSWMPDLDRFIEVTASLIKPGGYLLVEELHPILGMYEEAKPSYAAYSYFNTEPFKDTDGLDYFTGEKYDAIENYSFHYKLADILNAAIAHQLQLMHINELSYNVGNFCADLEHVSNNPPLAINLAWRKLG